MEKNKEWWIIIILCLHRLSHVILNLMSLMSKASWHRSWWALLKCSHRPTNLQRWSKKYHNRLLRYTKAAFWTPLPFQSSTSVNNTQTMPSRTHHNLSHPHTMIKSYTYITSKVVWGISTSGQSGLWTSCLASLVDSQASAGPPSATFLRATRASGTRTRLLAAFSRLLQARRTTKSLQTKTRQWSRWWAQ